MDEKSILKKVRKNINLGVDDAAARAQLKQAGLTVYEADQFILQEKTKASFVTVRWPVVLLGSYCWAALLYATLHYVKVYADISVQRQSINLATFALALFVVSLLFRPKPQNRRARSLYTSLELAFTGALVALTVVLLLHPGWNTPNVPDGGALASTLWPFLWLGAWLGPQVLAVVIFFIAHYALLNIRTSYFLYRQSLLLEQRREALRSHYQCCLSKVDFVPAEHIDNLALKLVNLLLLNRAWNPKSTIDIYSLGKQIQVQPLGGGSARLTATDISPTPLLAEQLEQQDTCEASPELILEPLNLALYQP